MSAEEAKNSFERDQVVKIINSVISKVEHNDGVSKEAIFDELKSLQKIIDDARKEIGLSKSDDIKEKDIPTATDELDAVVEATAEATGTIMDCCDAIQEAAAKAGGEAETAIVDQVMKVYEACSFQDITGQRITKVVTTLRAIEEKVERLITALGNGVGSSETSGESEGESKAPTGDEALLNGPQMADDAISQDEIDKLLSEFD